MKKLLFKIVCALVVIAVLFYLGVLISAWI